MEPIEFKDMTPEQRSEIVEAKIAGRSVDFWSEKDGCWYKMEGFAGLFNNIFIDGAYRITPRKLDIPWHVIKPEYKWAAMDANDAVCVYLGSEPVIHDTYWKVAVPGMPFCNLDALNIDTTGIDWRESLTERPEGV